MSAAALKHLNDQILRRYEAGPERGGAILLDGTIVEFTNHADKPTEGFCPDIGELLPIITKLAGTWHTHPSATSNLSVEDAETFIGWPHLAHAIAGNDGVRWYEVSRGAVINA